VFARPTRWRLPNRGEAIKLSVLAGITVAAVARQLGVSRPWASREANAAGMRCLIAELLEGHREQLSRPFNQTLDVIEDAFRARRSFFGERGGYRRRARSLCPPRSGEDGCSPAFFMLVTPGAVSAASAPPDVRAADAGGKGNRGLG